MQEERTSKQQNQVKKYENIHFPTKQCKIIANSCNITTIIYKKKLLLSYRRL